MVIKVRQVFIHSFIHSLMQQPFTKHQITELIRIQLPITELIRIELLITELTRIQNRLLYQETQNYRNLNKVEVSFSYTFFLK